MSATDLTALLRVIEELGAVIVALIVVALSLVVIRQLSRAQVMQANTQEKLASSQVMMTSKLDESLNKISEALRENNKLTEALVALVSVTQQQLDQTRQRDEVWQTTVMSAYGKREEDEAKRQEEIMSAFDESRRRDETTAQAQSVGLAQVQTTLSEVLSKMDALTAADDARHDDIQAIKQQLSEMQKMIEALVKGREDVDT